MLAYSAGLGTIVSSEDKIRQHLRTQLATNCAHADGTSLVAGNPNPRPSPNPNSNPNHNALTLTLTL